MARPPEELRNGVEDSDQLPTSKGGLKDRFLSCAQSLRDAVQKPMEWLKDRRGYLAEVGVIGTLGSQVWLFARASNPDVPVDPALPMTGAPALWSVVTTAATIRSVESLLTGAGTRTSRVLGTAALALNYGGIGFMDYSVLVGHDPKMLFYGFGATVASILVAGAAGLAESIQPARSLRN